MGIDKAYGLHVRKASVLILLLRINVKNAIFSSLMVPNTLHCLVLPALTGTAESRARLFPLGPAIHHSRNLFRFFYCQTSKLRQFNAVATMGRVRTKVGFSYHINDQEFAYVLKSSPCRQSRSRPRSSLSVTIPSSPSISRPTSEFAMK